MSNVSSLTRDLRSESRVLGQAWLALQDEVSQLDRHKSILKHEWKDLEEERQRLDAERSRFEKLVMQEWFPTKLDKKKVLERVVKVNIGGQIFEINAKLLLKDRFSLLAATCLPEEDSILRPDKDGCYFFDRDWFLFRQILVYLQSGTLPRDQARLRELYHEAGFFCLGSMQREIGTVLADMEYREPKNNFGIADPFVPDILKQKEKTKRAGYQRAASASYNRRATERKKDSQWAPKLADPFGFTSKATFL
mmetsp:Transcript_14207/g.23218  ORF Transcript_14207/g.23218 Transcript_14207/m.23218 type:complete len:251 (+) Transcript_14207:2251-3003(+)